MKCSVNRAERNECSLPDSRPVREEQGTMPPAAWEADRPVPPSYAWCLTLRSIPASGVLSHLVAALRARFWKRRPRLD